MGGFEITIGEVMASRTGLSDAEMEVLKTLWEQGPATIREINQVLSERGKKWAYTTVATLLHRLQSKQAVKTDSTTPPHVYQAARTRSDLLGEQLEAAANEFCDGKAAPLVLSLVQSNRFTAEELARFRQLIDKLSKDVEERPGT